MNEPTLVALAVLLTAAPVLAFLAILLWPGRCSSGYGEEWDDGRLRRSFMVHCERQAHLDQRHYAHRGDRLVFW